MSTDADHLAANKQVADETAASAVATANWPTGGYNTLIPLVFISICAVLVICVDVSTVCLVRAYITRIQYVISNVYAMFMIYYWIKLNRTIAITREYPYSGAFFCL